MSKVYLALLCIACLISLATAAATFKEACNLSGNSYLLITPTMCSSNNFTLAVPASTRLQVTGGPYSSPCGITYYMVYTFDMNAGFVDSRNLCNILSVYRGGDRVQPCKVPSGSYLNMYPTPLIAGNSVGVFTPSQIGIILSDPVYNSQRIYTSKVLVGSTIGYIQTDYVCLA